MERQPLTAERWRQIEAIFHQAVEVAESARGATLTRLCATDPGLRGEVEAMLAASDHERLAAPKAKAPAIDLAGRRVGNYRLERMLGEGGMGSVYLASRADGQFEQQAAVKLLAAYLRGEFFTDRFRVERQALANLNHPNVTRILDSGVTPEGDPFLVMEYVDGLAIDEYCDQQRMPIAERIKLFLQVCEAVEYAHRNRIVHRDLKPGNIFVTREGVVKLLDFGTAKLLAVEEADITRTRFRMMTPRYASPEQLRGEAVTHEADVYSLGIVLYELLTGAWPFGDPQSVISGLERAVREVEPRHPRSVIEEREAARRGLSKTALIDLLGGDLWKVTLKAIQGEPDRRYTSVTEFAQDLQRYLSAAPVLARPQDGLYRARKFARRNRAALLLALAGTVVAAGLYSWWPVSKSTSTEASIAVLPFTNLSSDPANRYFSDGLTDEITDAVSHLKPLRVIARASAFAFRDKAQDIREVGRQLHVSHVLEGSVERYGDRVKIVARLERTADGVQVWSNTYDRQTSSLFSIQSELASSIAGNLKASMTAPNPAKHVVRDEEAIDSYRRAMFETEQFSPQSFTQAQQDLKHAIERDPQYAAAYAALGAAIINGASNTIRDRAGHQAMLNIALPYYRKALELDPDLVAPRVNLATFDLQDNWDWAGAEKEYQRALAAGPNATANQAYGLMLVYEGRFQEADEHLRQAEEQNPYSASLTTNLISARTLERRYAQARELAQMLLTRSPQLRSARMSIAWTYVEDGRAELALAEYAKIAPSPPLGQMVKAQALASAGRRDEALELIRPMEANYQSLMPAASFAAVYGFLGDEANAMSWLEKSASDHDFGLLYIKVDPAFDRLRNSPRFQALLKRMGLA